MMEAAVRHRTTLVLAGLMVVCFAARADGASVLVEQVAPWPLHSPGPAEAGGAPHRLDTNGGSGAPAGRSPNLTSQTQIGHEDGPSKSVALPELGRDEQRTGARGVINQSTPAPRTATVAPMTAPADRAARQKGLTSQPGRRLTGSEAKVFGKPTPEFMPPDTKPTGPTKEVATPKTGADTAARAVTACQNRETAPDQPEATLTPPDRCAATYTHGDPRLASQRLKQAPNPNGPQFTNDAAAIGLVPGAGFPYGGAGTNPFLPLPVPAPSPPGANGAPGAGMPPGPAKP